MAVKRSHRGRTTKALLDLAYHRFHACQYCSPDWVTDYSEDLLDRLRLRVRERLRLKRALKCPQCESELDPMDEIVCYDIRQLAEIRRHRLWEENYACKFEQFEGFLEKYPSLGTSHEMGKVLADGVRRLAPVILPAHTWYRARRWTNGRTLTAGDMLPPDPRQVPIPAGRFNHAGQVGLYAAEFPEGTAIEVLDDPEQASKLWVAEIEFIEPLRVLDLSVSLLGQQSRLPVALEGLRWVVTRPRTRSDKAPREHYVSRFVADLIRKRNLDGVVYISRRDDPYGPGVLGRNLVVVRFQNARVTWGPVLHDWKLTSAGHPFGESRMSFDPEIPVWWWEKLKARGLKQSDDT